MGIYDLPVETLEEILLHADPIDVASLSQSSRLFARLIYQQADQHIWRWLYLCQALDDPRGCVHITGRRRDADSLDWKTELQAVMRARMILDDVFICRPCERVAVLETLVKLVEWVPPLPAQSRNLVWVGGYLADGRLIDKHNVTWQQDADERQLRSKLHVYFGTTPEDTSRAATVRSRAYVYDFRHYTWATDFGPFLDNRKIDWEFLQALRHSISVHLDETVGEMSLPLTQISMPSDEDWKRDWAGVEGTWDCAFCFCDHLSLTEYNQSATAAGQLNTSMFEDPDNGDIFRSIPVILRVLQVVDDPNHPRHPRIYFGGEMGGMSSATMSGFVYMSHDDQVCWRFRSGEQVNPIWSSEGVQVGGLRSQYGVLGTWTTTFHQPFDPVGKFRLECWHAQN